ncbi:hypothetical protein EES43_03095 [Streptomyces sp. ADI96-02]|uniref:hypothetical protein n=1 Tax=unclassified Streptomyces TaxID=2593676 RepID=UPI000F555792|nr:hypothetical protein [Streptomyces sp. ADI96-02]RPK67415.1 hypothetical protein EES43_03095 [Streptomyces sp. ADI96-02]
MKTRHRKKRTAVVVAGAATAAAAALLIPFQSSATEEPAAPASASAATSIVYDPGPKLRCYSVSDETGGVNYGNDSSDCGAIDNAYRVNDKCTWFGYTSPRGVECPAWRFVTYDWDRDKLRQYPGYDHQVQGQSGSPLKLVLQNNSKNLRDATGKQDCDLKETTFSYEYIGSSFKRHDDGKVYNFSDGRVKVSYDALVEQTGGFSCDEKRAILTTDFIYKSARGVNVISVVHFDPGPFSQPDQNGVLWSNKCRTEAGAPDGCRLTVYGQRLEPGKQARIDIDFTEVAKKYAAYLNDDPIPADSQIEALQVVTSTKGADLKAEVSGADVTVE